MPINRTFVTLASSVLVFGSAASRAAAGIEPIPVAGPSAIAAPAPAKVRVHVIGRVKNPGDYTLDAGARLSDVLIASGAYALEKLVARTGGTPLPDTDCMLGGANLRSIFLTRATETSRTTAYLIDVTNALRRHDLRYDPVLQENDKIFVPECLPKVKIISTPPLSPAPAT